MPASSTMRSREYHRDDFGIIDIDTSRFRYSDEPYILATLAEPVFFVPVVNKPGWSSVITLKQRNLFAMSEAEGAIGVDSIDPGFGGTDLFGGQEDLSTWTRSGNEGTIGDASVINQVHAQAFAELDDDAFLHDDVDEEDDTYINDGVVAPIASAIQGQDDDEFFV